MQPFVIVMVNNPFDLIGTRREVFAFNIAQPFIQRPMISFDLRTAQVLIVVEANKITEDVRSCYHTSITSVANATVGVCGLIFLCVTPKADNVSANSREIKPEP